MTSAVSAAPTASMKDNSPATPLSVTELVSSEFMDESYQVFDSYGKPEEEQEEFSQDSCESSNTFWNLLSKIYIPILFLRLRRSIFGVAGFVRSILFGQCVQALVAWLSPSDETWEALSHSSPWLVQFLGNAKDSDAWPSPTLKLLVILTLLAFIVHPDGMTWIMLGKLRNAIYTLLESSTTCWNFIIADYGILSTCAALATFASLFGLMYVLHKTLTPRTPKTSKVAKSSDRKKKKRKGNHPRGGRARIKGKGNSKQQESFTETEPTQGPVSPAKNESQDVVDNDDVASMDTSQHKTEFLPKKLTTKGPATLQPSRSRGESSSTVETVAMDDHSIESASVQSISSAPSAASTVVSRSPRSLAQEGKKKQNLDKMKSAAANSTGKKDRKGSASKGQGAAVAASPPRPDVYRPPSSKNATVYTPPSVRSRSGRGGEKQFRSLADRMAAASPVPAPNDSLFSSPMSSPTHTSVATGRPNISTGLQAPTLSHPPAVTSSPSLFSHEQTTPSRNYPGTPIPTVSQDDGGTSVFEIRPISRRSTAGKKELAAFLARAGVAGTACEDLVEALDHVDALYKLSDAQFELYNVSPDQKLRIDMLLEARRRARQELTRSPTATSPATPIRPPPGLTAPSSNAENYLQPTTALSSPPRLHTQVSYTTSDSSPSCGYMTQTTRTDVDFGGTPQIPSLSHAPFYGNAGNNSLYEQDDEEIEAELQELGGQMVGSVLDF